MEGCTEKLAPNYNPDATINDGSCIAQKLCVQNGKGFCENCVKNPLWGPCTDGNNGFRHPQYDRIYAGRVKEGFIKVDGDISEWKDTPTNLRYTDVPFANETGEIVIYQKSGKEGEYYGRLDFSVTAMMAWDSTGLYIAADVIDDRLQTPSTCYKNGLQVAFEVGGEKSLAQNGNSLKGLLQAKRSEDLSISNLILLNIGLQQGQTECQTTRFDEQAGKACCIHYEHNAGNGWSHLVRAGITRNEEIKHTTYEVAFDKYDLLGNDPDRISQWAENLRFGFSYLVNDGDEKPNQSGWAGYYPSSIANGPYNQGNKEPWKSGVLQLHQGNWHEWDNQHHKSRKSTSIFGLFSIGILLSCLLVGVCSLIRRFQISRTEDWRVWRPTVKAKHEVLLREMVQENDDAF